MKEKLIKFPGWIWFVLKLLYPIFVFEVAKLLGMMLVVQITGVDTPQRMMLANGVGMLVAVPIMLWIYLNEKRNRVENGARKREITKREITKKVKVAAGVLAMFLGGGMALLINAIFSKLDLSAIEGNYQEVAALQYSVPILAGIFLYGVLAPLTEELLFRGIVYQKLKEIVTPVSAMVFSALLFGVYHGNGIQFLYGSVMGFAMAYCYYKTDNLLTPILFHSGANIASYLVGSSESLTLFCAKPMIMVLLMVLSVGTFILFSSMLKRNIE